jgi:hypothetical protein
MLSCRFSKATTLVFAAALSCASANAQTSENSAASSNGNPPAAQQPATQVPPQVVYGGTVSNQKTKVVPVGGETKIHGSTVPRAMMPREESLGDAARRLKRKKYRGHKKHAKAHRAKQQPPYLR